MAIGTLETGDIAEIKRMLERPVSLVAGRALEGISVAQVDGMLETAIRRCELNSGKRLIESDVADRAVIADHLSVRAGMLAIVTAETALIIEMADIVNMACPVRIHLREKVCAVYTLDLRNGVVDSCPLSCGDLRIIRLVISP